MAEKALSIRQRALGFLARREHSRLELKRKLAPHAEDEAEVDALLEDFQKRGWLSEKRYTEQVVHARRGKYGAQRIVQELREKGVGEEAIGAALPELKDSELETARAVWAKKFGQPPVDAKDKARQVRFLASRGFSQEVIWKVLRMEKE
jgi:regulatory protein